MAYIVLQMSKSLVQRLVMPILFFFLTNLLVIEIVLKSYFLAQFRDMKGPCCDIRDFKVDVHFKPFKVNQNFKKLYQTFPNGSTQEIVNVNSVKLVLVKRIVVDIESIDPCFGVQVAHIIDSEPTKTALANRS